MGRTASRQARRGGRPRGRLRGFTLVEALSVLAVLAVLMSVAVPSFGALTGSMRVTTAANTLLADLHLTRAEAMKRRTRVVICKSADGLACAAAGSWQQGWIVFADANADGERGPSEPVLQRQQAMDSALHLAGNATVSRYVAYAPDGATRLVGGGFQAGTLTICRQAQPPVAARQIVISASGRPRVQKVLLPGCD